jgi:hypothetical protein
MTPNRPHGRILPPLHEWPWRWRQSQFFRNTSLRIFDIVNVRLGGELNRGRMQGYRGARVRDIVSAASVPQGSFTNHFTSIEAFAQEVLEEIGAGRDQRANLHPAPRDFRHDSGGREASFFKQNRGWSLNRSLLHNTECQP